MDGKPRATYQDVETAPAHQVAELIDGELFLSPRPGGPHASVMTQLSAELVQRFRRGVGGPGGWLIIVKPELHLDGGGRVVVPDLAGWKLERMPTVPDDHKFTVVPDWVCEIASLSTEKFDRRKKLPVYARSGVGHAWIVQPRIRALNAFRRQDQHWLDVGYFTDADVMRAEPFDAVEIDLAMLWQDMPQPTRASEPSELAEMAY